MKSTFILLALLLCNSCLSGAESEVKPDNGGLISSVYDFVHRMIGKKGANDDDSEDNSSANVPANFNEISLADLVQLAPLNSTLSQCAAAIFRRRYHDYNIRITQDAYINHADKRVAESLKMSVNDGQKEIKIYDYQMSSNIVKYFGHAINKLTIDNSMHTINSSEIYQYVKEYASSSISFLNLGQITFDIFKTFDSTFPHIEELIASINVKQTGHILPFNQIFPQLRRLTLFLKPDADYSYINCAFDHLEYVSLNVVRADRASRVVWSQIDQIEGFLQKNSQIQNINFEKYFPLDFIATVHKHLTNLESLGFSKFNIGNRSLAFDSVKQLFVPNPNALEAISTTFSFPHLQSLSLSYSSKYYQTCRSVFHSKYQQIEKLDLVINDDHWTSGSTSISTYEQLTNLLTMFENLIELNLRFVKIIKHPKALAKAINKLDNLRTVHIVGFTEVEDFQCIRDHSKSQWIVNDSLLLSGQMDLVLVRKNSTQLE